MARRALEVAGLALTVVAALCALCSAQTTTTNPAAAAGMLPNCAAVPITLSPCISYVLAVGTATTLSSCCSQLQAFFQSQGPCLCAMAKLAPSPFGLVLLGQVQGMIPNVCNLPSNPCDDIDGASSVSPADVAPAAPLDPTATTAPETTTTPAATPAAPATATTPPVPAGESPAAVATNGSQTASTKLPQLLHASAGARSSREKAAAAADAAVLLALFLACVSTMGL